MTVPAKKLTVEDVKSIIKRWSELGIDEAFTNADLKAQLVELLVEVDCPKWLAQLSVKMLTPVVLSLAKGVNSQLSKKSPIRVITLLLKVPGVEKFFHAMNRLEGRIIEKDNAKKTFEALLKSTSPTAHDLNALLDPGLSGQIALMEQTADALTSITELKTLIESNSNPQPLLELHIEPATESMRFVYRSRAIPFIGDDESLTSLCNFRDTDTMFSWYLILGLGGTGKSRLALEFLLNDARAYGSAAGFLNISNDPYFDWGRWQPTFPTFIVIDYAARQSEQVEKMFGILSSRVDLDWPVRVLLLERQINGSWFERIIHQGRSSRGRVEEAVFEDPLELLAPDNVWPIIEYIVGDRLKTLDPDDTLSTLASIDPEMRPLYAAFMADALSRGENPRGWDRRELVDNVLDHEQVNYWQPAEVTDAELSLVAVATMTAGYPIEWLSRPASHFCSDYLPKAEEQGFQQRLSAIYGYEVVEAVPPLEPDILGEVFVLEEWSKATPNMKKFFVRIGAELAPWFADFFSRMTEDFPDDIPDDFLKMVFESDFGEYEPTRSEMIYNTIMDFAETQPKKALTLFDLLLNFDLSEHEASEVLLVDQMEAAFNLMVGLPEDMIGDRMNVLEKAHMHLMVSNAQNEQKARYCEAFTGCIDSVAGLDVERFEPIAQDILSFVDKGANDPILKCEAIKALSAYVTAHDKPFPIQAALWYDHVEKLCCASEEPVEIEAWFDAAYHNYVLFNLTEDPSKKLALVKHLEELDAPFVRDLENRFKQDFCDLSSISEGPET
ncbi:hypothetical protein [Lentilitoribacter sp. EG35]|uniref:hypothetical protein n=1 Tax=Lentilitoribacter sp. EG35 TaxID=3234192 RepID=UPI00345F608F